MPGKNNSMNASIPDPDLTQDDLNDVRLRAARIKLLLMDVDGVLTDGRLINVPAPDGTIFESKIFDSQDGIALQWLSWHGIATGVIYTPGEALADPNFVERGFPVEIEHPELGRSYTYPGAPYRFTGTPWSARRAPLLGEHQDALSAH